MRRTRHRTLAITGLGLLISTHTALAQPAELDGHWAGELELPGQTMAFDTDFASADDGLTGDLSIPKQGAKDLRLTEIVLDGQTIAFRLPDVPGGGADFSGTISDDGQRIEGTILQGGMEFAFWLERGDDGVTVALGLIEGLGPWIEDARQRLDVPGASVAIVKDGQIIFAEGFGLRDVDAGLPATADTLFAIGSCTKAFTTFVVGTLVDEGTLDWDEPVRATLPWFALQDEWASDRVTLRDLCSHRSGLPRHDLTWYGRPDADRRGLVRGMRQLEPSAELREVWQYNNLAFLTAGVACEAATGQTWEQLVADRVFAPLGMERSNFSIEALTGDADHARPYFEADGELDEIPYRHIEHVAPAGAINSSANEMALWLTMLLDDGKDPQGQTLIEAPTLAELGTPQMLMPGFAGQADTISLGYGLGWMVASHHGHVIIQHGGGIDGFTALVTLVPSEDIGIVVLTNSTSGLTSVATSHALDTLLEIELDTELVSKVQKQLEQIASATEAGKQGMEDSRIADAPASHDLEAYAGAYDHAAYGRFTIEIDGEGGLSASLNALAGSLAHRHYDVFDFAIGGHTNFGTIPARFQTGLDGSIESVELLVEASVEPIVFERKAADRMRDPAYLATLAGRYTFEVAPQTVTIAVRGSSLTAHIPGQPVLTLEPKGDEAFSIKDLDGFSVRFVGNAQGEVDQVLFIQPNGTFRANREKDEADSSGG